MPLAFVTTFLLFATVYPVLCFAHGVQGQVGTGGITILAEYTTGEPMSYASVEVLAPASKLPFQIGRTDRNGRFCFFPDAPGKWKVVVNDKMGHRLELLIPVDKAMKPESGKSNKKHFPFSLTKYERALMGLSIIFGITGIIILWKGVIKKMMNPNDGVR